MAGSDRRLNGCESSPPACLGGQVALHYAMKALLPGRGCSQSGPRPPRPSAGASSASRAWCCAALRLSGPLADTCKAQPYCFRQMSQLPVLHCPQVALPLTASCSVVGRVCPCGHKGLQPTHACTAGLCPLK